MDLHQKILASKTLTEAYDAIMNAVGMDAWLHLENMMIAQEVRRNPWTVLDADLLKRLRPAAKALVPNADPQSPAQRLESIIEQMAV